MKNFHLNKKKYTKVFRPHLTISCDAFENKNHVRAYDYDDERKREKSAFNENLIEMGIEPNDIHHLR